MIFDLLKKFFRSGAAGQRAGKSSFPFFSDSFYAPLDFGVNP